MRFLLVEDNQRLSCAIKNRLSMDGHIVDDVSDVHTAETMLDVATYDMILLDLMLPDGDGMDFLRKIRREDDLTPVIVITAKRELSDRVNTLDVGADDFVVKPFAFSELEARCRAVLRRKRGDAKNMLRLGDACFDMLDGTLTINGEAVTLRNQELRLFEALFSAPNRVFSKSYLVDRLFSFGDDGSENAIEVYVGRLRKKLLKSKIEVETVRGRGYRLVCRAS